MCCISLSEDNAPPYHCCCGCRLLLGVIFIFIVELLTLFTAIELLDITGIIVSGILTGTFLVSFFKRESVKVRFGLFSVYLGRALIFAFHMAYFMLR